VGHLLGWIGCSLFFLFLFELPSCWSNTHLAGYSACSLLEFVCVCVCSFPKLFTYSQPPQRILSWFVRGIFIMGVGLLMLIIFWFFFGIGHLAKLDWDMWMCSWHLLGLIFCRALWAGHQVWKGVVHHINWCSCYSLWSQNWQISKGQTCCQGGDFKRWFVVGKVCAPELTHGLCKN
jgi:hypothetical protein